MEKLPAFVLSAPMATNSLAQCEVVSTIKTRSDLPGIRIVSDLASYAVDLRTERH